MVSVFSKRIIASSLAALLLSLGANASSSGHKSKKVSQSQSQSQQYIDQTQQHCEIERLRPDSECCSHPTVSEVLHEIRYTWEPSGDVTKEVYMTTCFEQTKTGSGAWVSGGDCLSKKPCMSELSCQQGQASEPIVKYTKGEITAGAISTSDMVVTEHTVAKLHDTCKLSRVEDLPLQKLTKEDFFQELGAFMAPQWDLEDVKAGYRQLKANGTLTISFKWEQK